MKFKYDMYFVYAACDTYLQYTERTDDTWEDIAIVQGMYDTLKMAGNCASVLLNEEEVELLKEYLK